MEGQWTSTGKQKFSDIQFAWIIFYSNKNKYYNNLLEKVPINHGNLERLSCYKFQRIQPELEVIQEETCTNVQIEEKNQSQRINDSKPKDIKMVVLKNGKSSIVSIYNAQIY